MDREIHRITRHEEVKKEFYFVNLCRSLVTYSLDRFLVVKTVTSSKFMSQLIASLFSGLRLWPFSRSDCLDLDLAHFSLSFRSTLQKASKQMQTQSVTS